MKKISASWGMVALVIGSSLSAACSGANAPVPSPDGHQTPAGNGQGSASGSTAAATPAGAAQVLPDSPSQAAAFALVTGQVTDQGPGSPALGLAGQGTLNAATTIQLSSLLPTGALQVLGQAAIGAGGSFSIKAPLNVGLAVAQALGASGQVLGSVVVGATGSAAGSTIVTAPMTTQTSLQSQVLTTAAACGTGSSMEPAPDAASSSASPTAMAMTVPGNLLALDVATLINAEVTGAVSAAIGAQADAGAGAGGIIAALSQAIMAGAHARVAALAQAGVSLDLGAFANAQAQAIADFNAGMNGVLQGTTTFDAVTAQLAAALDAAVKASGAVSISTRAQAQAAVSVNFSASLNASLAIDGLLDVNGLTFAAVRATAQIEAGLVANAVVSVITAAGAPQATIDAAVNAGAQFVADVGAATSLNALTTARANFAAALSGGTSTAAGGLLGGLVTATGNVAASLQAAVDGVVNLAGNLDGDLTAKLQAMASVNVCLNVDASVSVGPQGLDVDVAAAAQVIANFLAQASLQGQDADAGGAPVGANAGVNAAANAMALAELALRVAP
jgi:trimeric autotransporter adhesin